MLVKRSLTIKQMAVVTIVALATICIFIVVQMFDFIQQRKNDYATQLDNIAYSVTQPLERALWKQNNKEIQKTLDSLIEIGMLSKADLVINSDLTSIHSRSGQYGKVPTFFSYMLSLPIRTSIPLYVPDHDAVAPQAMGQLVLEADSYKLYQYTLHKLSTVLATYLLLALMLSISISWFLNRLLVYPLRNIANDLRLLSPDDIQYHQLALPVRHQDDELGMLVRNYNRNQQALVKAHNQLSRLSTRDPVTDLPNYSLFQELLRQQLADSHQSKAVFSLLFVNLDSLKEISRVVGRKQGDQGLIDIVERTKLALSDSCVLARLHGEELIVLNKSNETPLQVMQLAQRLMEQFVLPMNIENFHHSPSVSIGIAQYPNDGETPDTLIRNAQSAMLLAQRRGKNQILFFEPDMTNETQHRLRLESDIVRGIEENQFCLYLQPQIDIATGKVYGAEALVRWHYADDDIRLPKDFIPIAEEAGLILHLGHWIVEEACSILSEWNRQGIELSLSVNISAIQLQQPNAVGRLAYLMERYTFKPEKLTLELTETAHIYDLANVLPLLTEINRLGVSIALDDFGTGYCNLNYLKLLPVDELKIDKSFIDSVPDDGAMVLIVKSIAQALSLKVVAEGVEFQAQADWLAAQGIHCAQGYLFSRALPYETFKKRYIDTL
ncbi:biofilm formation regulator HmsP [Budvicia diplopodorum]|uniref:biofilm formation regulator HmsP n=1 Tax=Budvicia diplopodorum TaxID=1119056 RepID=UPI0013580569|nr:biofilm formation regulator HmsP [Budvicia diplopodorum]